MSLSVTDCLSFVLHFLGVVLICASLFLYEDEEGKFQNKVEEWWIKLSDKQKASRSRVAAFMQGVARLTGMGFDRLFGKRLFSLRVVAVSIYLSVASLLLFFILLTFRLVKNPGGATRHGAFQVFLLFVGLALVPALLKNKWVLSVWWAVIPGALVSVSGFMAFLFKTRGAGPTVRGIGIAVIPFVASLLCDLAYIALTRYVLRRIGRVDHIPEIVIMTLGNVIALAIPLLGPIYVGMALFKYARHAGAFVLVSVMLNTIDILVGTAALFLAILLLLHRLFWPMIQRPLYAIYRYAPLKKGKKTLLTIGVLLLALPMHFTVGVLRTILKTILEKL